MINDRFNEMYLKQNQAKNFEKNGNTEAALKAYLSVINEYTPTTDFPYERACHILMQKTKYEEAKKYATEALKKLKNEDITGKGDFFVSILKKVDERSKPAPNERKKTSHFTISSNKITIGMFILFGLLVVLISLPDKIWKLVFLVFVLFSIFFFIEIINDLKKRYNIKLKTFFLILSICISIYGAIKMPRADWQDFASFPSISEMQNSSELIKHGNNSSNNEISEKNSNLKITESDLADLKELAKSEFELMKYSIKISDNNVVLKVQVNEGTTLERGKAVCESLLKNLNLIKGKEVGSDDKLGDLYKTYSVQVELLDFNSSQMAVGDMNKKTQKISWIH